MKRILTILALALVTATAAHAQFGVIGGFTSSTTSIDSKFLENAKNASLYHVGFAYKIKMGPFVALQPQIAYQMKGANLQDATSTGAINLESRSGYAEVSLGAQAGIDLLAFRPFIMLEPFLGYQVTGTETWDTLKEAKNKLEYGFGLGGGLELFNHVQLSIQWFKNLGNLYDGGKIKNNALSGLTSESLKDINNYTGLKITLGIFF